MSILREEHDPSDAQDNQSQSNSAIAASNKEAAPMLKRASVHRDRIDQVVRELESEKFELVNRIEQLRRQFEAVEQGFNLQIADIEETLKLYESGLNSVPLRTH